MFYTLAPEALISDRPYNSLYRLYYSWVSVHWTLNVKYKCNTCSSINNNNNNNNKTENRNMVQWQTDIEPLGKLETEGVGTYLFSP